MPLGMYMALKFLKYNAITYSYNITYKYCSDWKFVQNLRMVIYPKKLSAEI
jgi:hypothetical protein